MKEEEASGGDIPTTAEATAAPASPPVPIEEKRGVWRWFSQYILFGYFSPYMRLAKEQGSAAVRPEQLPELWPSDDLAKWFRKFSAVAERDRRSPSRWQLLRAIGTVFWMPLTGLFLVRLVTTVLSLASIILMGRFLRWQELDPATVTPAQRNRGIVSGVGILVLELVNIITTVQANFWAQRVGIRVQGVLAAGLFQQIISPPPAAALAAGTRLKNAGQFEASPYNLLMVDVPAIAGFVFTLVEFSVLPLRVALSFQLLVKEVGMSAVVGLITLVVAMLVILGLEVRSGVLKAPYLAYKDVRLTRCHDTLATMRTMKMVGWEDIAVDHLKEARNVEIDYRRTRMFLDSVAAAVSGASYAVTQIAIFIAYVVWGLQSNAPFIVKASVVIPVLQIISRLVGPLTNLPFMVNTFIEGWISIDRYQTYVFGELPTRKTEEEEQEETSDVRTPRGASSVASSELSPLLEEGVELDEEHAVAAAKPWTAPTPEDLFAIRVQLGVYTWGKEPEEEEEEEEEYEAEGQPVDITMGESGTTAAQRPPPSQIGAPAGAEIPRGAAPGRRPGTVPVHRFHLTIPLLEVRRGECVAVVGPPGGGKTSVVLALLGEMPRAHGYHHVTRSIDRPAGPIGSDLPVIGYASQAAWIPEGTVRSVILFGRRYDPERYAKVVEACELRQDFMAWPKGEETWVSEGGGTLSAGQRTRVGLARALYDYPETPGTGVAVFLLDAPFASVDPRAGTSIFRRLFGPTGLLRYAATVLTVDEANLLHYLGVMEGMLSVRFKGKIVVDGCLTDATTTPLAAAPTEPSPAEPAGPPPIAPPEIVHEERPVVQPEMLGTAEAAFTGAVEKPTYAWYNRHIGVVILLAGAILICTMHLAGMGADLWVAQWTAQERVLSRQVSAGTPQPSFAIQPSPPGASARLGALDAESHSALRGAAAQAWALKPKWFGRSSEVDEERSRTLRALTIFVGLSSTDVVCVLTLYCLGAWAAIKAAKLIHAKLFRSVVFAPLWFHDVLSLGTLLNRFAADVDVVDGGPIFALSYFFGSMIYVLLLVVALAVLTPWCVLLMPLVGWLLYTFVYLLYRPACREFQRAKLLAFSPLCGNLSEAGSGAVVIRALGGQKYYTARNLRLTTDLLKTEFMKVGTNSWATTRLQLFAFPFTVLNSVVPITLGLLGLPFQLGFLSALLDSKQSTVPAGYVGFAISLALALPTSVAGVVWSVALLEQKMCSVQRVKEIISGARTVSAAAPLQQVREEEEEVLKELHDLPTDRTGLALHDVSVTYETLAETAQRAAEGRRAAAEEESATGLMEREALPPSLTHVTAVAGPFDHVGIVGRTGAGKTTLLLSVLNLVPTTTGVVLLDGVPLRRLQRHLLHQVIGIVPQAHTPPRGWTLRKFLDPYGEFPDDTVLLAAITRVNLHRVIEALPERIDTVLSPDGSRRGVTKRQRRRTTHERGVLTPSQLRMLVLARLSLHADRYRIILIDEPPARQIVRAKKPRSASAAGEIGSTADVQGEEGGMMETTEFEPADIVRDLFPKCTVLIVGHHADSLRHCTVIWVLSGGRLVERLPPDAIGSQDELMKVIQSYDVSREPRPSRW